MHYQYPRPGRMPSDIDDDYEFVDAPEERMERYDHDRDRRKDESAEERYHERKQGRQKR